MSQKDAKVEATSLPLTTLPHDSLQEGIGPKTLFTWLSAYNSLQTQELLLSVYSGNIGAVLEAGVKG